MEREREREERFLAFFFHKKMGLKDEESNRFELHRERIMIDKL